MYSRCLKFFKGYAFTGAGRHHPYGCYGYSIYISYITYPIIPTQTFVIKSPSLYLFLTYPFRSHFTWGSGPLRCMACMSPLGLMGFYLGCHLWKVASLLTLDARTLLCGLQNFPHLLSI